MGTEKYFVGIFPRNNNPDSEIHCSGRPRFRSVAFLDAPHNCTNSFTVIHMQSSRFANLLLALALLTSVSTHAQAPGAQSLSLIPIPREVRPAAAQSLANGVQINCSTPCPADDLFAIDDLKAYLAAQGIAVNGTSPVNILFTRYGTQISKSIYSHASPHKPTKVPPPHFPAHIKPTAHLP